MAPETPRGVSSRLLTMKFMQRAAASASTSSSPDGGTSSSSKKRKLDHSPPSGRIDLNINEASIKAALEDQEVKRQAALRKHTVGDTHWVLKTTINKSASQPPTSPPLNIVYVGYGETDSANDSGDEVDAPTQGRTSTNNYKKAAQGKKSANESQSEDNTSEESSSEEDNTTPRRKSENGRDAPESASAKRSRSRSQSRSGAENMKAKEFRDKRKKKEVRLSKLTSISSAGGSPLASQASKGMTCYNCHQIGHRASDCPKRK
ncbi:hypothetical protein HJFPF1_03017 [Paramyrothecium foliicola]|nr:hypothetical protein HJFPF1_03017 [Paramyrothecium foliicola]